MNFPRSFLRECELCVCVSFNSIRFVQSSFTDTINCLWFPFNRVYFRVIPLCIINAEIWMSVQTIFFKFFILLLMPKRVTFFWLWSLIPFPFPFTVFSRSVPPFHFILRNGFLSRPCECECWYLSWWCYRSLDDGASECVCARVYLIEAINQSVLDKCLCM